MSPQRTFGLLALAITLGLLLPDLVQRGMFMDGLLYTVVAHNQAHGFGTFWEPRYSQLGFAGLSHFHEHPPLVFGIQGAWFRLFGDAFWVERAYCLFTAALAAGLIMTIWRALWAEGAQERKLVWWPVLLWIIIPPVHWSLRNNMQENTMAVFCLAATWCVVRGIERGRNLFFLALLAGLFTLAAVLSKGPPGAYPLAAPVILSIFNREARGSRGVSFLAVMTLSFACFLCLLLLLPEARESLATYADQRLLHRVEDAPTVDYRWRILQHLLNALLGPVALALLLNWATKGWRSSSGVGAKAWAMTMIGLAGILPLMLTMVQKSFYMVQGLGPLALGLALWSASPLASLLDRLGKRTGTMRAMRGLAVTALVGVIAASVLLWGRPGRDADMLHDVALIGSVVPEHTLMGADAELWSEWNLQSYLMRDHFISIGRGYSGERWHLGMPGALKPHTDLEPVPLPLRHYQLWQGPGDRGR